MGNGPEQEKDGESAGDSTHKVDTPGGRVRVVAEEDDKKTAQHDEERGAGRVGDLEFIAAGNEFTAVPKTAGRLHGQNIHGAGDEAYCPAGDPIQQEETVWHGIYT